MQWIFTERDGKNTIKCQTKHKFIYIKYLTIYIDYLPLHRKNIVLCLAYLFSYCILCPSLNEWHPILLLTFIITFVGCWLSSTHQKCGLFNVNDNFTYILQPLNLINRACSVPPYTHTLIMISYIDDVVIFNSKVIHSTLIVYVQRWNLLSTRPNYKLLSLLRNNIQLPIHKFEKSLKTSCLNRFFFF